MAFLLPAAEPAGVSHDSDVLDIDELAAACSTGLITAEEAERAIETTLNAVEGITRHDNDPMGWLRSTGINLSWTEDVELTPATL